MVEKIIRARDVEDIDAWVMPEMDGSHVVRSNRKNKAGGFKKAGKTVPANLIPKALTVRKLEEIRAQVEAEGLEQGRETGYQQGYAEAQSAGREMLNDYKVRMEQLLESLAGEVEAQLQADRDALSKAIADLVTGVTEQVCMQQIACDEEAVLAIVKTALSGLPASEKHATLRVHPDDYKLLEASPAFNAQHLSLSEDESLSRGSCRVNSEHSEIRFVLDERIKDSVKKHFAFTDTGES